MNAVLALTLPDKWLWYLTRGSGAVALVVLTASVVLGVATSVGAESKVLPRFVVQALHRNLSLLISVFVLIHVAASVSDGFVPLGWLDAIVPMRAEYRRIWTGLGAFALDILLAIAITSLLRSRLSLRTWRLVHLTSYASWPIALVHSLGTGSDTRQPWMLALAALCTLGIAASIAWRLAVRPPADRRVFATAMGATVVVPLLVGVWMRLGPLHDDWGFSATASAASATAGAPLDEIVPGMADTFAVTLAPTTSTGRVAVVFDAALDAHPSLTLALDLHGRRTANVLTLDTGTVAITDGYDELVGTLASYANGRITAVLTGTDGRRVAVELRLALDARGGAGVGTLTTAEATS